MVFTGAKGKKGGGGFEQAHGSTGAQGSQGYTRAAWWAGWFTWLGYTREQWLSHWAAISDHDWAVHAVDNNGRGSWWTYTQWREFLAGKGEGFWAAWLDDWIFPDPWAAAAAAAWEAAADFPDA